MRTNLVYSSLLFSGAQSTMLKLQTDEIIAQEMREIEAFQKKSNMSLFESIFSSSMWRSPGGGSETSPQANVILKKQNFEKKKEKQKKVKKWTERDTQSMMDLMEVALKRVKEKLKNKRKAGCEDEGLGEDIEVEQLEDQVLEATNETMTVLKEITSVMQVIAEVTIEEHEEEEEDAKGEGNNYFDGEEENKEEDSDKQEKVEDDKEDEDEDEDDLKLLEEGVVGKALAGEPEADQWSGLVKRLSTRRSQRRRKKSKA